MERLLILDGNSLMNRAFYAIPLLSTSEGIYTNAVYGFTNMLLKMKEDIKPDYIVATFDRKAKTFRHIEYKDYKAGRKKMPDELGEQFPIVKEMLNLLSISIFEMDGFEADDLIGTVAKYAEKNNIEVYIVTGDRDALQLASDNIKIVLTKKGVTETEVYDKNAMIEEYGVTPTEFIDVKGLMGDKSDNIPGVPGIGEKTAYKLIKEYGSVEGVLSNIDNISGKKLKENLTEYSEQAIFSKKLATIKTDVPVEFSLDEIKSQDNFDIDGLRKLLFKLQMPTVLKKLELEEDSIEDQSIQYTKVKSYSDIKNLEDSIKDKIFITFNLKDEEVYSKLSIEDIFISIENENYIISYETLKEDKEVFSLIKGILENQDIKKISNNIKNALTALRKENINLKNLYFDTAIAAYLLDSSKGKYPLITLVNEYLGKDPKGEDEEILIKLNSYLNDLYECLYKKIKKDSMEDLLFNVELPLAEVLSSMEQLGFKVNENMLNELRVKFKDELEKTEKEIFTLADESFNINSPKQLGKILFEKLDLPVIKKTKTGYSTNAEVLEKLSDKHPIINKITYFRQLSKIYSTYIEGLSAVIDKDGCIHSNFNQTVTTTGRLSSTEPNLQNIPIKYEMGREIRKVFIPREKDDVILSADYSQIELRVLADIAKDENMINAFKHHSDIHTKTASEVFNVPIDEVTKEMRSGAKAVNFGIVYGISDFSLAQDLNITRKEAKEYMDIYFDRYPNIKKYLKDILVEAKDNGYVKTIMNRRRFIPEITASNKMVKAFGERLAMNAPIQGSAADIIKLAMVNVYKRLNEKSLKSKIILQVHDELILNVVKEELEEVRDLVKEEMENVIKLNVPLEVDINTGNTWYDVK
ncbi:DNA polymerase I [Clostridium fallax]|uniref:DNA polymerase I n=1 Tax=Clostridium fallax TaxID=1533 RepID=A0A1M4WXD0_9CLOT|nr:DNA polymerase I [Clostridium fallax]SHE85622.1 DNA polymerase I [Clostridium fallax]SQB07447.1 DNA polymerase I [Clostridium fallax]